MHRVSAQVVEVTAELKVIDGSLGVVPVFLVQTSDGQLLPWRGGTHEDVASVSEPGTWDLRLLFEAAVLDARVDLAEHGFDVTFPSGGAAVKFVPTNAAAAAEMARFDDLRIGSD